MSGQPRFSARRTKTARPTKPPTVHKKIYSRRCGMPKFLLTAEANLDYPFLEHRPQVRGLRRDDLFRAFSQGVETAVRERVDFFLVAGNLFHHHNPANDTLSFVIGQLDELTRLSPRTQVVLVPGEKELKDGGNALRVLKFIDHVNVLDPVETPSLNFNTTTGNVTVVCMKAPRGVDPAALPKIAEGYGVLVCHNTYHHFFQAHPEDLRQRKEVLRAIGERGYAMVVLGQGLRAASFGLDDLPCVMPGAVEHVFLRDERPHPRSVTLAELSEGGARTWQVPLSDREVISRSVLFQLDQEHPRRLLEPLLKDVHQEMVLRLELQGELPFKTFRDMKLEQFLEKARERCFDVVLYNNLFLVDNEYVAAGEDIAVIKPKMEFVRTMHDLIAEADEQEGKKGGERARQLQRVLDLGVKEFEG